MGSPMPMSRWATLGGPSALVSENGSSVVSQSIRARGLRVWIITRPGPAKSKTNPSPDFSDWTERPSTARRSRLCTPASYATTWPESTVTASPGPSSSVSTAPYEPSTTSPCPVACRTKPPSPPNRFCAPAQRVWMSTPCAFAIQQPRVM